MRDFIGKYPMDVKKEINNLNNLLDTQKHKIVKALNSITEMEGELKKKKFLEGFFKTKYHEKNNGKIFHYFTENYKTKIKTM